MKEYLYEALLVIEKETQLRVMGTIQQISNWADNVIRANPGNAEIFIRRLDE